VVDDEPALRQALTLALRHFMTGNTHDYAAEELLGLGAAAVLEKPFGSLPELARLLRQVAEGDGQFLG
jgi:hypothetical protein